MRPNVFTPLSVGLLLAVPGAWTAVAAEDQRALLGLQATLEGEWWITGLAFSPDSKVLASAESGGTIRLWDVARGKSLAVWRRAGDAPAFSPDGKTLATCADWKIKLWDVASRKNIATIRNDVIVHWVVFSPDGKTLTAVGKEWLSVWSLEKKRELRSFKLPSRPSLVTTSSAIKRPVIAIHHGASFLLLDAMTGESILTCEGHKHGARKFALNRDETLVASAGIDGRMVSADIGGLRIDGTVKLWDRTSGKEVASFKYPSGTPWCLAFSPDAKLVALGFEPGPVTRDSSPTGFQVYKVSRGELLAAEEANGICCLAFSPDGRVLASGGLKTIKLWTIPAAWLKKDK